MVCSAGRRTGLARTTINGRAGPWRRRRAAGERGEVSARDLDRARDYAVSGRGGRRTVRGAAQASQKRMDQRRVCEHHASEPVAGESGGADRKRTVVSGTGRGVAGGGFGV